MEIRRIQAAYWSATGSTDKSGEHHRGRPGHRRWERL